MTDHELLEQIKQSAQDIKAPESLTPESVAAKLTPPKTAARFFQTHIFGRRRPSAVLPAFGYRLDHVPYQHKK